MRELVIRIFVHVNDVIREVFDFHWRRRRKTVHHTHTHHLSHKCPQTDSLAHSQYVVTYCEWVSESLKSHLRHNWSCRERVFSFQFQATILTNQTCNTQETQIKETPTRRMAIANRMCVSIFNQPKAPGTIAVNVTWMKREFNACQMHRSMYPSIFNHLRAIVRYWSEIATFSCPLAFNTPLRDVPIGIPGKSLVLRKLLESCGYQALKTVWR